MPDATAVRLLLPFVVPHPRVQVGATAAVLAQMAALVVDGLFVAVTALLLVAVIGVLGASARPMRVLDGPLLSVATEAQGAYVHLLVLPFGLGLRVLVWLLRQYHPRRDFLAVLLPPLLPRLLPWPQLQLRLLLPPPPRVLPLKRARHLPLRVRCVLLLAALLRRVLRLLPPPLIWTNVLRMRLVQLTNSLVRYCSKGGYHRCHWSTGTSAHSWSDHSCRRPHGSRTGTPGYMSCASHTSYCPRYRTHWYYCRRPTRWSANCHRATRKLSSLSSPSSRSCSRPRTRFRTRTAYSTTTGGE